MDAAARRQLVEDVLVAAQKSRSNYFEALGTDDTAVAVFNDLNPTLAEGNPLNLIDACLATTAGDREVGPSELFNILFLAGRSPIISAYFAVTGRELPEPLDALA